MAKIFIACDDPRINTGYSATAKLTLKQFQKMGHECFCFTFNGGESGGEYLGAKVIEHPRFGHNDNEVLYGTKQFLLDCYKEHKPDILFFHNDFYRQSWFLELPQEIQEKSIWWIPLDMVREEKGLDFSYLNLIPNLYFVSESAAKYTHVNYKKIIPHAVDYTYFNQPKSEKINKEIFTVCRVDRHQPRKQWPYAIDAFSIFAKGKNNVKFLAKCNPKDSHGFDPDTRDFIDLRWFSDTKNISDKITFIDTVQTSEDMISNIFDQSDVFLTTTGSEGFGLGLVEAMTRGCVPIFPNGSSLPEIVENNGYRYNYGQIRKCPEIWAEYGRPDIMVVAEKLQTAYNDWKYNKEIFKTLSKKCIEKSKTYHPDRIYGIWDEEITKIINKNKSNNIDIKSELKMERLPEKAIGDKIKYSIIIVSKDKVDMLKNCIKSIIDKTNDNYEIIIIENCGSEKSYNEVLKFERNNIKVIRNTIEGGFTYANNLGIKEAKGEYIVLLNNDTIIESENWLEIPRKQMQDKNAELIGPSICWFSLTPNENDIPKRLRELSFYNDAIKSYCCYFTGFWFVMAKAELFKENPLNENIKHYIADDVDYCLRMTVADKKWIAIDGIHNDGHGLIKHLQEQSRGVLQSDYKDKGIRDFFNEWKSEKDNVASNIKEKITITIPTRNREIHLNRLLVSILYQSYSDWDLIICNDGKEFSKETKDIINFIIKNNHNVEVLNGPKKGPAYSHDLMMRTAKTDWIYRVDDDNILDKDCLLKLVEELNKIGYDNVGAIAPLVLNPFVNNEKIFPPKVVIDDFLSAACVQQNLWYIPNTNVLAEHLHSSFLYNRNAALKVGGFIYSNDMESIVSYGEETVFTYKLFIDKKDLYITNQAITWHFIADFGGTRDNHLYTESVNKDYQIYLKTIEGLKVKANNEVLNCYSYA